MAVDDSITHSQIWQFLKCLRVVYFDTSNNESHKSGCIWALSNGLNIDDKVAELVFDKLAQISARLRSTGGLITRQELIEEIRDLVPNFPDKIDRTLAVIQCGVKNRIEISRVATVYFYDCHKVINDLKPD